MNDKRLYPNTVIFKGTDDNEITYINERVLEQIRDEYKTPCSLCRYIDDDSELCDMCPAMPREKGE